MFTVNEAYLNNTLAKKSEILSTADKNKVLEFVLYPVIKVDDGNLTATAQQAQQRCFNVGRKLATKQEVIDSGIKISADDNTGAYIATGQTGLVLNSGNGNRLLPGILILQIQREIKEDLGVKDDFTNFLLN